MGLFGPTPPKRITSEEFKDLRQVLYNKLDRDEWAEIEKIFDGHLNEKGVYDGITREEFEQGMSWLSSNMSKHKLEENDLELVREYFEEHLKD